MSDTNTALEQWLTDTATEFPGKVRVGLCIDGERVHQRELRALAEDESQDGTFELREDTDVESKHPVNRYLCRKKSDELSITKYQQHRIPTADEFQDRKGEVYIEIDNVDSDPPPVGHPPDSAHDAISAGFLLRVQEGAVEGINQPLARRVAGLDAEKAQIKGFLTQSLTDWGLREETGMLLKGPPGTGKTDLVSEVCEELYGDIPETIEGPEVMSRWVGESEATLRQTFKRARESGVPVLYIDEIDAIGASRIDSTQDYTAQIVSQLLVLLDGIGSKRRRDSEEQRLKVIASTNAPQTLDPALTRPGRLGDRVLEFNRPVADERRAIFHHYLERIHTQSETEDSPLHRDLVRFVEEDPEQIPVHLIEKTEQYTGADIESVILVAARNAMQTNSEITPEVLETALDQSSNRPPTESESLGFTR